MHQCLLLTGAILLASVTGAASAQSPRIDDRAELGQADAGRSAADALARGDAGAAEQAYRRQLALARRSRSDERATAEILVQLATLLWARQTPPHDGTLVGREVLGAAGLNAMVTLPETRGGGGQGQPLLSQALVARDGLTDPRIALGVGAPVPAATDHSEAVALYLEALEIYRRTAGPPSPDPPQLTCCVDQVLDALGGLYRSTGNYAAAEPILREALALRRQIPGGREKEADLVNSLTSLGLLLRAKGENAEAQRLFEEAAERTARIRPRNHPYVAATLNNLGAVHRAQGQYELARDLFTRALAINRAAFGDRHPETAASMNNLAGLHRVLREFDDAEPLYREALEINRERLGQRHLTTANSLNNLALVLADQARYAEAEPLLREALDLARNGLGPRHPDTALRAANLAGVVRRRGDPDEAAQLLEQVLDVRLATWCPVSTPAWGQPACPGHTDLTLSTLALAEIDEERGRKSAATRLYRQASDMVVGRTRSRYAREMAARAEFDRFRGAHGAFVSAAWSATPST